MTQSPKTASLENLPFDLDDPRFRSTPAQQMLSSCSGALLTSFFVTPLDVVKIRMQAQQKALVTNRCFLYCNGLMDHYCSCGPENPVTRAWVNKPTHFNGTIDAFVKITRTEGIGSLWSGLSPTLVLAVPATVAYFVTYEQLRLKMKDWHNRRQKITDTNLKTQPAWIPIVAGGSARIFSATIVSPLELIRTKMQSAQLSYGDIFEALRSLLKNDGVIGLWKGLGPTLLRDVPFSAIYWTSYEFLKKENYVQSSLYSSFIYGAISGSVAATMTVPFDVVKTHQQIEIGEKKLYSNQANGTSSMRAIFQRIYKTYGVRGLFAGLTPRLIKVAPACAIMISTFEHGKQFFQRYNYSMYQQSSPISRPHMFKLEALS